MPKQGLFMHLEKGLVVQSCSAAQNKFQASLETLPLKELGRGRTDKLSDRYFSNRKRKAF